VASLINADLEQDFELLFGAIRTVRNLRAEVEIKPSAKVTAIFQSESDRERQIVTSTSAYIQHLARVETLTVVEALPADLGRNMAGVVGTVQVVLPLEGIDLEAIRAKLEKSLQKAQAEVTSIAGRLSNAKFVSNAPAEVVQGARDALAEAETQVAMLTERLERL
jgi:valyl-tRNA synthetase